LGIRHASLSQIVRRIALPLFPNKCRGDERHTQGASLEGIYP
jgi:hypothetical protein